MKSNQLVTTTNVNKKEEAKKNFRSSCRLYLKGWITGKKLRESFCRVKLALENTESDKTYYKCDQFFKSQFEARFSTWSPEKPFSLLLVTVGAPDGIGDLDHFLTILRILKKIPQVIKCKPVLFIPHARKEAYERLLKERLIEQKADDLAVFCYDHYRSLNIEPKLPPALERKFRKGPTLYVSTDGSGAYFVKKATGNNSERNSERPDTDQWPDPPKPAEFLLAEFGGTPSVSEHIIHHDGHMGIGSKARGISFNETLLEASKKTLRERQLNFVLENQLLEKAMLQGRDAAEYFAETELFRAYLQINDVNEPKRLPCWHAHYMRSIVCSRSKTSRKDLDFSMSLPFNPVSSWSRIHFAEFVETNGKFLKEFGVGSIEVFKDGNKINEATLGNGPGKKLRFFVDYLSPADEAMMYSVASGPAGGSGDNTYAKALSYQPGSSESKKELAPLPFFQLPRSGAWASLRKMDFVKELLEVVRNSQGSCPDNLKEGYVLLAQYFQAAVDFAQLYEKTKTMPDQINASRKVGEMMRNQQLNEAYNHFLAEIQKYSLEHNLQTMVRAIIAETCYPVLAQVNQELFSDMVAGKIAYEEGMFLWDTLCEFILGTSPQMKLSALGNSERHLANAPSFTS